MNSSLLLAKSIKRQSKLSKMTNLTSKEIISEWRQIKTSSNVIARRSCHSSSIHNHNLYIYGGYDNNFSGIFGDMFMYSFQDQSWKVVMQKGQLPGPRHSHSSVIYKNQLYLFGGMIGLINNTNALHKYNLDSHEWKVVKSTNLPKSIDSHKACLYKNQMIIGFGYSQDQYTSNLYSLDMATLDWKLIYDAEKHNVGQYPQNRAFNSFNIVQDSIYVYGGKNFDKIFQDFWKYDLINNKFSKIQLNFNLKGRYSHSGIIFQSELFIFGGTKGVTYQKNDLLSINLESGQVKVYWFDSQQEIISQNNSQLRQTQTRSRRNSSMKKVESLKKQNNENYNSNCSPLKYRAQLKQVNYYNDLYNSRKIQEFRNKKSRKNPLLTELQKFEQQQSQTINLTTTFQILTNSIMFSSPKSTNKEQKSEKSHENVAKIPKARDNYTADLSMMNGEPCMIIFGGGMHKISFNDLIFINLHQIKNILDN